MQRVFFLERAMQRIDSARQFGRITYIFPPHVDRCSIWDTEIFCNDALDRLKELHYDPAIDFIAVTGHIIPLVSLTAALISEYDKIKVLFFNAADYSYNERILGNGDMD